MPILIRYAPSSLTREQYDKVNEILQENGPEGPPPPLQLHVMFGEEPDLRVSEIWESEDAWQQAWDGGLKAALSTAGIELPSPRSSRSTRSGAATSVNEGLGRIGRVNRDPCSLTLGGCRAKRRLGHQRFCVPAHEEGTSAPWLANAEAEHGRAIRRRRAVAHESAQGLGPRRK